MEIVLHDPTLVPHIPIPPHHGPNLVPHAKNPFPTTPHDMADHIWSKGQPVDDWVIRFTVGDDYLWDRALLPYDAIGTRAHAHGLAEIGVFSDDEWTQVQSALDRLDTTIANGELTITPDDEDCQHRYRTLPRSRFGRYRQAHPHRAQPQRSGADGAPAVAQRPHGIARQPGFRATLTRALIDFATRQLGIVMPGYTHGQRAMPTSAGLWAMGYAELAASDLDALRDASRRIDTSPLGSAAGYGVPRLGLPIRANAERIGFGSVQLHAPTVQLSRGKLELHAAHACVQICATMNRLASDLVLFATSEFGFVRLPQQFTTGSSIMPQKRNPDVLKLMRAYYHRVLAEAHVLMTLPANLPGGYHRDLQLTKEALMRGVVVTEDVLSAANALMPDLAFDAEACAAALSPELFATDRALELVQQGVPFRDAYQRAATEAAELPVPDIDAIRSAYTAPGTLGDLRPGYVVNRIDAHEEGWLMS